MVDLTRDVHGRTRARLLDLVPGRSGEAYRSWLHDRGPAFRDRVEIATLDPSDPEGCLRRFRSNRDFGWIVFAGFVAAAALGVLG